MSAAVAMTTFDQSTSGSGSMATSFARASVERIVMPYQAPGKTRSSVYFAAPVSFAGPSRRNGKAEARPGTRWPGSTTRARSTASVPGVRVRVGIAAPSLPNDVGWVDSRSVRDSPSPRVPRGWLWLDVAIKVATVALLAWALASPDLPQFQGKAFAGRAIVYPIALLALPVAWWLFARRTIAYPVLPDILIGLPFLID